MADSPTDELEGAAQANGAGAAPAIELEDWQVDAAGREFVGRRGRQGLIFRRDGESVEEARVRDARTVPSEPGRDDRPRRRTKRPKMPEAPRKVDLKALEKAIADALKQPAIACAMAGDEWGAHHFETAAPYLARNLVQASEYNPWLRERLTEMATGQDAMMKILPLFSVAGAVVLYTVPPVIYWLNLPVPDSARARFGIPPRKEPPAPNTATDDERPPAAPAGSAGPFPYAGAPAAEAA